MRPALDRMRAREAMVSPTRPGAGWVSDYCGCRRLLPIRIHLEPAVPPARLQPQATAEPDAASPPRPAQPPAPLAHPSLVLSAQPDASLSTLAHPPLAHPSLALATQPQAHSPLAPTQPLTPS